jgi:hypothetical protein
MEATLHPTPIAIHDAAYLMTTPWRWATLFLLGAFHGLNPGMGWLFAVALGMQEKSSRAVFRALIPITLGHALAIGAALLVAGLVEMILPLAYVKLAIGFVLIGYGLYRLYRSRHFGWSRMQVGFAQLTLWSFLMATAHGAGLMVLPVVTGFGSGSHSGHSGIMQGGMGIQATLVHTAGYLAVTAAVAFVVFEKLGLAVLRSAWLNLDFVWAVALIVTGCAALVI